MKITIDLPDDTKALSITAIYEHDRLSFDMGNNMFGTKELKDGVELTFVKPKRRGEANGERKANEG